MNRPQILLIEDEVHIAQGIIFNLEADGCRVVHAETGTAALAALENEHFSLVVLDLMLPDMDGLHICQQIREENKRLPILILTARGDEGDRVRGLELGADDYMTKPFNLSEFLLRVQGMLRRSEWYRPETGTTERYAFGLHDVFVVPPWCPHRFQAEAECVLFSFSDRAAQEALGFWREELERKDESGRMNVEG